MSDSTDTNEFDVAATEPTPPGMVEPGFKVAHLDEFDEATTEPTPPETSKPGFAMGAPLLERMSKKPAMRLLVGLGVVGVVLLMYPLVLIAAIFRQITVDEAKELLQLITIPATLAGTVVGFLFGREV